MIDWEDPFDADEQDPEQFEDETTEAATQLMVKLGRAAASVAWFSRIGEPLRPDERKIAEAYCDALGFPETQVVRLMGWSEAAEAAEVTDWDSEAWSAGEQLRAALVMDACTRFSEDFVQDSLQGVLAYVSDTVQSHTHETGALWEVTDEAVLNLAAGAALRAVHNAALVLLAGSGDDHALALEYRLFEHGRWPVMLTGRTLHLF